VLLINTSLQVKVCKDFFRKCTGFNKKHFNKILNYVRRFNEAGRQKSPFDKFLNSNDRSLLRTLCGNCNSHLPSPRYDFNTNTEQRKTTDLIKGNVLAFLDAHFKKGDIDQEGGEEAAQYTRDDWKVIFAKYEEHVKGLELSKIARYEKFCSIRYVIVIS
jgi:hypothetical protein